MIVTGGGGNFGRAGAVFFHERKARVVVVDVVAEPLEETMKMLSEETALSFVCDITKEDQVSLAEHAVHCCPRVFVGTRLGLRHQPLRHVPYLPHLV